MKEIVNGMTNEMKLEFDSRSANEAFARVTVASFMTQLNPGCEKSNGTALYHQTRVRTVRHGLFIYGSLYG